MWIMLAVYSIDHGTRVSISTSYVEPTLETSSCLISAMSVGEHNSHINYRLVIDQLDSHLITSPR